MANERAPEELTDWAEEAALNHESWIGHTGGRERELGDDDHHRHCAEMHRATANALRELARYRELVGRLDDAERISNIIAFMNREVPGTFEFMGREMDKQEAVRRAANGGEWMYQLPLELQRAYLNNAVVRAAFHRSYSEGWTYQAALEHALAQTADALEQRELEAKRSLRSVGSSRGPEDDKEES